MDKAETMTPTVSVDTLEPAHRATARRAGMRRRRDWWKRTSIYQIYPLSFQDSDGDGMGDIPGILSRLDHLSDLGIGTVWLSPVYPSPMADFGYDIADFVDIDPRFGTLADFDALLAALHARDISLILDFVPNHTSIEHPWFAQSRASRGNDKSAWYVWSDPGPDGGPPNNWLSRFGGSAWEWEPARQQYYYHAFLKQQPDLNWRNPQVRQAMADVLRFWLRRGVDGFRVDASAVLGEDDLLRDDPPNPNFSEKTPPPEKFKRVFTDDRPESLQYLAELRRVVGEFPDRVLAGEVQGATGRIGRFYGDRQPIFHLPLNFCLLDTPWDVRSLAAALDQYLNAIPDKAWPDWVLGGHDKRRIASRVGAGQARVAAMLLFTLPGTPFFYSGDELGMRDVEIPPDRVRDPFERLVPGYDLNRDPERAPMRWDGSANAGFTTGEPWLPMGDDVESGNVEAQRRDPGSILNLYRSLIALRAAESALVSGRYQPLRPQRDVLLFARGDDGRIVVALNLGHDAQEIELPDGGEIRLSTHLDRGGESGPALALRPDEGVIVELRKQADTA